MTKDERQAIVIALWAEGYPITEIAQSVGTTSSTVSMDLYQLRRRGHDLPKRKAHPVDHQVRARRDQVRYLWGRGYSAGQIANIVGASKHQVNADLRWWRLAGEIDGHDPHQNPERVRRRKAVARLWRDGYKADQIAARLGIARSTVYEDISRLRGDGEGMAFRKPGLIGNTNRKGHHG